MELIQNLLSLVIPPITIVFLCLALPFLFAFRFIHFILRHLFPEKMKGKVVLITGASSGIGEHLAYEYAKKGAYLVIVARREKSLRKVAEKAENLGSPDVLVVPADVSSVDQCKKFIDEAVNHFGRLDHLVCNAGIASYCAFQDIHDVTKFAPVMASKAALIQFFDSLRIEVAPEISIVVVTLGFVESEITQGKVLTKQEVVEEDQSLRNVLRGNPFPIESTEKCAKAIVRGVCSGNKYITEPWLTANMIYLLKIFSPEVFEWIVGLFYRTWLSQP